MRYVNRHGLPDAFFRAVVNDPYDNEGTYSPSTLNSPARAVALAEQHEGTLEVDVSTRVAATIGQGAHAILERAARPGIDIVEVRFKRPIVVDGVEYMVSSMIDLFATDIATIQDWKTTKAYAFHKKSGRGKKVEWEAQLNVGAWVLDAVPDLPKVKHVEIIGLLKDWDIRKAKTEPGYPETEIMVAPQRLWTLDETAKWITERIRAIVAARKELPLCTTKETWGGNRCGRWCDSSVVCSQYQEMLKTGLAQRAEGE